VLASPREARINQRGTTLTDEDNKDLRRSPQDARETGGIIIPHFRRSIYAVLCWPVNDETELGSKEDLVALPIFSNLRSEFDRTERG
jgi:hypothetical protein